jgi:hypothetical protein
VDAATFTPRWMIELCQPCSQELSVVQVHFSNNSQLLYVAVPVAGDPARPSAQGTWISATQVPQLAPQRVLADEPRSGRRYTFSRAHTRQASP